MEQIIFLLATSIALSLSRKTKGFKKYFIGNTGCSAHLFGSNAIFETSYSKNGDATYCNEFTDKGVLYGIICIDLKDKEHTIAEAELLLTKFLQSLHQPFSIEHVADSTCHHQKNIITITDYWQDRNKKDWKINGLTNGKVITVLYVKNIGESDIAKTEAFLNGFAFKAK